MHARSLLDGTRKDMFFFVRLVNQRGGSFEHPRTPPAYGPVK